MTLIVGAVFAGCLVLLVGVAGMLIASNRGQLEISLGVAGNAILSGFGLLITAVAYWSGSWLFLSGDEPVNTGHKIIKDYPGEWRSDTPDNLVRTLISNNIRGYGEFHYKLSARNSGEYLIYCTEDGQNWTTYLVWPNVDRISGPTGPDPSISPPQCGINRRSSRGYFIAVRHRIRG